MHPAERGTRNQGAGVAKNHRLVGGHHKKVEITEIQLFLGIGVIISTTTYVETQSDTKKFLRKPHTG